MAKKDENQLEETPKEGEVILNRLDSIGGTITLPSKAAADRLLKLEAESGVKNYEYPTNGDSK